MTKAITTTKAELQEYHKELIYREQQERKDKFILLSLAVAGLMGVYVLVVNGVKQNNLTESTPVEVEYENNQSTNRTAVSSLQ